MKKTYKFIGALLMGATILTNCAPEKKTDNTPLLGLVLLNNRATARAAASGNGTVTGTRQQQTQASAGRSSGSSAAGAARSAGRTSFIVPSRKGGFTKSESLAYVKTRFQGVNAADLRYSASQPLRFLTQATSAVPASGPTCTGAGCSGDGTSTFSGNSDCGSGTWKGGNLTLNDLVVTMTGADQDGLTINMTGGSASFTNCKKEITDFENYPGTQRVTLTSGTVTARGSYRLNDSFNETTNVNTSTITEDITSNSTNFVTGGQTLTLTNMRSVTALTETSSLNDLKFLNSAGTALASTVFETDPEFKTVYGVSGITTANGSLTLTGQVNGADAGAVLNLSNKRITWRVLCTKAWGNMTDTDWASESICTYTFN